MARREPFGGSDLFGFCEISGEQCFSMFQCPSLNCIAGRTGAIKLGEIEWDGTGTVSLGLATRAVDRPFNTIEYHKSSGCQLINGEEVLAGEDSWPIKNPNGIANRCECGDANGDGFIANADLMLAWRCASVFQDTRGTMEPCKTLIHQGDTNNDGAFGFGGDLVRTFTAITSGNSASNVCRARPNPVE